MFKQLANKGKKRKRNWLTSHLTGNREKAMSEQRSAMNGAKAMKNYQLIAHNICMNVCIRDQFLTNGLTNNMRSEQ